MSTLGNTTVTGRVTQTLPAQNPNDLLRLGEAQQLLISLLAGAWNSSTTFTQGQLVTRSNGLFLLQAETSQNQDPATNPSVWTLLLSGGANGSNGSSAWLAFANDNAGTGFSLTPGGGLDYIGFAYGVTQSNTAGDYSGWTKYSGAKGDKGDDGDPGDDGQSAYVYIGYASDAAGTGFSLTPGSSLNYIAVLSTNAAIGTPEASNFAGLWKQYGATISTVASPLTLTNGQLGINAASANTAGFVVQRDGNGNFTAGTVTLTSAVIGSTTLSYSSSALQINTPVVVSALAVGNLSGVLLASSGVISGGATSNNLAEGTVNLATPSGNAYFTQARVRATPLTGYTTAASSPVLLATDTVLAALGKLDAALISGGNYASLTGATFTGTITIAPAGATGGSPNMLVLTGAPHTTLAGGTEASDAVLNLARTVQFNTGALTLQRAARIEAPTYSFVAASTLATAVTLNISGAPVAGTNATVTNSIGFKIGAGAVGAGTVNAYGLFVDAPTGAANNYAAAFNTGDVLVNAGWLKAATGYGVKVNGVAVLSSRRTGWTAATGTATRTSFATGSVTLPNLAAAVKALIDDLVAHGLIGA